MGAERSARLSPSHRTVHPKLGERERGLCSRKAKPPLHQLRSEEECEALSLQWISERENLVLQHSDIDRLGSRTGGPNTSHQQNLGLETGILAVRALLSV